MCKHFDAYCIRLFWSYVNYSQSNEVPKSRDTTSKVIAVLHLFQKPLRFSGRFTQVATDLNSGKPTKVHKDPSVWCLSFTMSFTSKIKIGFFLGSIPRNQNPITDNYCIPWYVTPLNQQFRRGPVFFIKKRLLRRAFSFASPWFHHHGSKAKLLGSHCRILSGSVTVGLDPIGGLRLTRFLSKSRNWAQSSNVASIKRSKKDEKRAYVASSTAMAIFFSKLISCVFTRHRPLGW